MRGSAHEAKKPRAGVEFSESALPGSAKPQQIFGVCCIERRYKAVAAHGKRQAFRA